MATSAMSRWMCGMLSIGCALWALACVAPTSENASAEEQAATTCKRKRDCVAPEVTITTPLAGAGVAAGTIAVTGTASDNKALAKVEIELDVEPLERATGTTTWSATLDGFTLSAGAHVITAKATDTAGNASVAKITVVVIDDTGTKDAGAGDGSTTAPSITTQPADTTVTAPATTTFAASATGGEPLSYQWQKNGVNIVGATANSYTTPPTTTADSQSTFRVVVSNGAGTTTSDAATLTVTAAGDVVCTSSATWPSAWTSFEDEVLVLLNQRRAAGANCGGTDYPPVTPLVGNADLRTAARCHSLDMAQQGYFGHRSLDGRYIFQRIYDAGYSAWSTDENIAGDYKTPSDVVAGWMTSPGHCAAIMSTIFPFIPYQSSVPGNNEVGVGYGATSAGGDWTLDFGWRSSAPRPSVQTSCSITPFTVSAGATFTMSGSGFGSLESLWQTRVDYDGILSIGSGASASGTFTATGTASAFGGEGHVVLFDYTTLQQVGRCFHK